jgi:hypothetical protein
MVAAGHVWLKHHPCTLLVLLLLLLLLHRCMLTAHWVLVGTWRV